MTENTTQQHAQEPSPEQKKQLKATLLTSAEGRLLLTGVALAFIFTFWLGVEMLVSPQYSQVLIGMTATQVLFGRAAGMAFAYSLNLEHTTVIPICIVIETILVLILYPLFVFSWRHLLVINWLKNIFDRTRKAAEARKTLINKYGIVGLFFFVWFPFWMTGPVIGCVIGFLLGLKTWLILTVVLAGTTAAIFGWAFFLRQFHEAVAPYSSYAAMVLMALLVIIIIVANLLQRTLHNHKDKG